MNVHPNATPESPPVALRVGTLRRWFDTSTAAPVDAARGDRIDWLRASPFVVMHLACFGAIWTALVIFTLDGWRGLVRARASA